MWPNLIIITIIIQKQSDTFFSTVIASKRFHSIVNLLQQNETKRLCMKNVKRKKYGHLSFFFLFYCTTRRSNTRLHLYQTSSLRFPHCIAEISKTNRCTTMLSVFIDCNDGCLHL